LAGPSETWAQLPALSGCSLLCASARLILVSSCCRKLAGGRWRKSVAPGRTLTQSLSNRRNLTLVCLLPKNLVPEHYDWPNKLGFDHGVGPSFRNRGSQFAGKRADCFGKGAGEEIHDDDQL